MLTAEREVRINDEDISCKPKAELDLVYILRNPRGFTERAQVAWDRSTSYERIGLFAEAIKDIIGTEELSKNKRESGHQAYFERLRILGRERLKALSFHVRTESARRERNSILKYIKKRELMRRKRSEPEPHLNEVRGILGFPMIERNIQVFPLVSTPLENAA